MDFNRSREALLGVDWSWSLPGILFDLAVPWSVALRCMESRDELSQDVLQSVRME